MIATAGCIGDITGSKGDSLRNLSLPDLKAEILRIREVADLVPGKERDMCMPTIFLVCALCHTVTNHSWLSCTILVLYYVVHLNGCAGRASTDRHEIMPLASVSSCFCSKTRPLEVALYAQSCFEASFSCFDVCI
jgi:hypothetical protein